MTDADIIGAILTLAGIEYYDTEPGATGHRQFSGIPRHEIVFSHDALSYFSWPSDCGRMSIKRHSIHSVERPYHQWGYTQTFSTSWELTDEDS